MIEGLRIADMPATPVPSIHVVDDEPGVRMALIDRLERGGHLGRSFSSGKDFLAALDRVDAGCVLLDIQMPDVDGLAVMAELRARDLDWPVIAMTARGDVTTAVAAMKLGAIEFIEKPLQPDLVDAAIVRGQALLAAQAERRRERDGARARFARLTPKEHVVLQELMSGQLNKTIAHRLSLSVRTVEMHRANLLAKLGLRSVQEAAALWVKCGDDAPSASPYRAPPASRDAAAVPASPTP